MNQESGRNGFRETGTPHSTGHSERGPENMSRLARMDSSRRTALGEGTKGIADQLQHSEVVF